MKGRELTSRLQASTTNKETINIILLGQVAAVLLADTTAVDDAGVVGGFGGNGIGEPLANSGVDFLGLCGGGNLAGSDGPGERGILGKNYDQEYTEKGIPDGLVGNDDLGPLVLAQDLGNGTELPSDDLDGLSGFTLLYDFSSVLGVRI